MGWGGADSPGGGADSSPDAPGGGLGEGAFGGEGPSVSGVAAQPGSGWDSASMEAFKEAISKALGAVDAGKEATAREAQREVERQALAQEIKDLRDREETAMGATLNQSPLGTQGIDVDSQVDSFTDYGKMAESQFDNPLDNSPPPSPIGAYSGGWADVQTEIDTSPTDYGTMATEEFDSPITQGPGSPIGGHPDFGQDASVEAPTPGHTDHRNRQEQISKSIVDRFGMPGNPHQNINLDSPSREALKNNPNMRNAAFQDLAFDMVELEMNKTQPSSAVEAIFGFINKAFNPAYGLGALAKSILGGLGFEVDPNLGQRALAAAITAFEGGEVGTKGMGGLMEGERNDGMNSINEEQAMKILTYVEPWAKGLSGKQIKYYFDRPEELEWVRNLWSSMNPTTAV